MEDVMMFESDDAALMEEVVTFKRAVPAAVISLRDQKTRIIANWALRVANSPAFRATPDFGLEEIQRNIPQILDAALEAIATSDPTMDPGPIERASELAAAHGRARLADYFGIGDVLAEFNELRHEVWAALWRVMETHDNAHEIVRELEARLNQTFDSLIIAAAESWVSAKAEGVSAS